LYQFPQFLEHCPGETIGTMVPKLCECVETWPEDAQYSAAESLFTMADLSLSGSTSKCMCEAALKLLETCSGRVFEVWGELLCMVLPMLEKTDVLALIGPACKERAVSEQEESRRLAARIIGSLADLLSDSELQEHEFVSIAVKLCDDKDSSVRTMIALSLGSLGSKVSVGIAEKDLWPQLSKLRRDQTDVRTRAQALRGLSKSAEAHKDSAMTCKTFETMIVPEFLAECEQSASVASKDLRTVDNDTYAMLETFAEVYAFFVVAAGEHLAADQASWTTTTLALRRMVTCNGPTVRHWCAFSMPAIALTFVKLGKPDRLKGVVLALATDVDVETRATLAAGIHEVLRSVKSLQLRDETVKSVCSLMTDLNNQVRQNALANFSEMLHLLAGVERADGGVSIPPPALQQQQQRKPDDVPVAAAPSGPNEVMKFSPVFHQLNLLSQESWRTQQLLADQLADGMVFIPQDILCDNVAPVLFQMARESTYLVRKSSMKALARCLRCISDTRRRDHIVRHFRTEWARGKVYWTRLAFIDGCAAAYDVFSRRLFRSLFSAELLELAGDPVANVKLRLATALCAMMPALHKEGNFAAAVDKLCSDKDPQVAMEGRRLLEAMRAYEGPSEEEKKQELERVAAEEAFFTTKKKKKKAAAAAPTGTAGTPTTAANKAIATAAATSPGQNSAGTGAAAADNRQQPPAQQQNQNTPGGGASAGMPVVHHPDTVVRSGMSNVSANTSGKTPTIRPPQVQPKPMANPATVKPQYGGAGAQFGAHPTKPVGTGEPAGRRKGGGMCCFG